MSIKSTTTLSRSKALLMYHDLRAELYGSRFAMTNVELGDALDALVEESCQRKGSACFDNYWVEDDE